MSISLPKHTAKLCKVTPKKGQTSFFVFAFVVLGSGFTHCMPKSKTAKKNIFPHPENGDSTGSTLKMNN